MKKTLALAMRGIAVLLFANSHAFAAFELGAGDDMGEGISFSETQEPTVNYAYDNTLPSASEMMAEGVVFSDVVEDDTRYLLDN